MRPLVLLPAVLFALGAFSATAQSVATVNILTATSGDVNPSDGRCDVDPVTEGDQCTLYAALAFANTPSDAPTTPVRIRFALPSPPTTPFEVRGFTLTRPVEIDCSTQAGFRAGHPVIAFQNTGSESSLFLFRGGRSTVRGCAFVTAPTSILAFVDGGGNVVEGNTFGLTIDGAAGIGSGIVQAVNLGTGTTPANGNRIGGSGAGQGNVFGRFGSEVSGLTGRGVLVGTDSNTVAGNTFGLDLDGAATRPGFGPAIQITLAASANHIGLPGAPNVLGDTRGITLGGSRSGFPAHDNVIEGNLVGLLPDGRTAVPGFAPPSTAAGITVNALDGGAAQATIVRGNTVAGFPTGIRVAEDATAGTRIENNRVGLTASSPDLARPNGTGVAIQGGSATTVRGNIVSGNTSIGISVSRGTFAVAPTGVVIAGNRVGTDAAGAAALGNAIGIQLSGGVQNVQVGGRAAGEGNVVSGNRSDGIVVTGSVTRANRVEGNTIGLDAAGTAAVPNGGNGVSLVVAPSNVVGGDAEGAGNVVSGNGRNGITISGGAATGNVVAGNTVGLARPVGVGGSAALGNGQFGIQIVDAPDNIVGGTTAGARNTVGANSGGIYVQGSARTVVVGNRVGEDAVGAPRPNLGAGVTVTLSPDARVGGAVPGEGNRIARHRAGPGIAVVSSTGVRILSNTFDRNRSGIDLDDDGPTPNDAGDPDTGANRRMNTPAVASAVIDPRSGDLDVRYSVDAAEANAAYPLTVQFYLADSTGVQGGLLLATDTYTTAQAPRTTRLLTRFGQELLTEGRVLATATDASGNTSEFSSSVQAVLVAAEAADAPPATFALGLPAPTPTRGAAAVTVDVPRAGRLIVEVFDVTGRRLAMAFDGDAPAGRTRVPLDASALPSGTYLVRATLAGAVQTQALTLVR